MSGFIVALGTCFGCGQTFTFNPDLVPSIPIDPETNLPPDLGGDPARAVNREICESCVTIANVQRRAGGLAPIPILPGAYEVMGGVQ